MNNFIDSKHFNRCKRLHPLISAALQILHFEQYLSHLQLLNDKHDTSNEAVSKNEALEGNASLSEDDPTMAQENSSRINFDPNIFGEDLSAFMNTALHEISPEVNEQIDFPDSLKDIFKGYKEYCTVTLEGGHGKTAQYYFQYTQLVNLFLRFSRSIRCSNYELYLDSLYNMCDLFFALNQPNYARYSILYLSNLIKLKIDGSPLLHEFRQGAFGIRRTKAKLARSPVDLSLEQTINADAGNTLTGVTHFTNSISARQKWALSHGMRTKILTSVKEETGLLSKDDTSRCLQENQIKKDKRHLNNIIETIKQVINPFEQNIDKDQMFNISTGKSASAHVTDFLLNISSLGSAKKNKFIVECNDVVFK
ncbi:unnamed protein product [Euphydryas editha]|uniref:Uncharacterized protein n=1 Tax=Euphydryas editha TaxID=104508 RepID=A0AAU9VCQ1_EUPED|nr:unnamed protein product [Euphydryas editha]